MATIKKSRKLRNGKASVAPWVKRYLMDRIPPAPGSEEFEQFQNWYFFGQDMVGLPDDWHAAVPDWQKWDKQNGRGASGSPAGLNSRNRADPHSQN